MPPIGGLNKINTCRMEMRKTEQSTRFGRTTAFAQLSGHLLQGGHESLPRIQKRIAEIRRVTAAVSIIECS